MMRPHIELWQKRVQQHETCRTFATVDVPCVYLRSKLVFAIRGLASVQDRLQDEHVHSVTTLAPVITCSRLTRQS